MSDAMVKYVDAIEDDFLPSLKTCWTALDLDGLKRDGDTRTAIDALGVVIRRMEAAHVKAMNLEGVNFSVAGPVSTTE